MRHLSWNESIKSMCTDIRIVVNIWRSFYTCIKFMCDINWWQILFSWCSFAMLCLSTQNAIELSASTDSFLDCFYVLFRLLQLLLLSLVWFVNIAPLNSSLTFDFNTHILSQCEKERTRTQHNIVAQHARQHWLALSIARLALSMLSFYFYLAFDDFAMFIQWFQSNFCNGQQCVSV